MPKKSVQTFNETNTKIIQGYAGDASGSGKSGKVEVEIVHNIYGSCAGAGSGEFDVYRAGKRREEMRLENLEKRDQALAKAAEFEAKITGNKRAAEERTSKNAEKRRKKKMKQKQSKTKAVAKNEGSNSDGEESSQNDESPHAEQEK